MECECTLAGWCNRHSMYKTEHLRQLCQTRLDYRNAWEAGTGPGQTKPDKITCPHLTDHCHLIADISGTEYLPTLQECNACTRCPRSQRLNYTTLTLISKLNPELDISKLESIVDGSLSGVGSRLAAVFGTVISERKSCGCEGRQDTLDAWTPEHIRLNMEQVIDWFHNEARTRRLPFSRTLAKYLILLVLKL